MSRAFVIPDVHLKPWMFEMADELIEKDDYDEIVILGDLVDDWGQEMNLKLYSETFDVADEFMEKYQKYVYFCYGNHDLSYPWEALETGYSSYAHELVLERLKKLVKKLPQDQVGFIHRIENVLFSHGGLTEKFVKRCFGYGPRMGIDELIDKINNLGKESMWNDDSPIWARPQITPMRLYPMDMLQVVGHTPVKTSILQGDLLSVDTFSTKGNGEPIGNQRFVYVNTVTKEYYEV